MKQEHRDKTQILERDNNGKTGTLRVTKIQIEYKQTKTEIKTARQEHRHREKTEIHKIETEAARQAENIERYKHRETKTQR